MGLAVFEVHGVKRDLREGLWMAGDGRKSSKPLGWWVGFPVMRPTHFIPMRHDTVHDSSSHTDRVLRYKPKRTVRSVTVSSISTGCSVLQHCLRRHHHWSSSVNQASGLFHNAEATLLMVRSSEVLLQLGPVFASLISTCHVAETVIVTICSNHRATLGSASSLECVSMYRCLLHKFTM